MSMYSDYLLETGSARILEKEWGFATYRIGGEECYIEDIYIVPDKRKGHWATSLADEIRSEAKAAGCKWLTGSVNTTIKDPTRSMRVLLSYGFKLLRSEPGAIWFVMEL